MKITITQIVLELEFPEQEEPASVREPNPLDTLLAYLIHDDRAERKQWEVDPHGTVFKV